MFWRNKQSNSWILVFFGFIALGIIVSVGVVIVRLLGAHSVIRQSVEQVSQYGGAAITGTSPKEVQTLYRSAIVEYIELVGQRDEEASVLINNTKELLQTVRVPKEKLDDHLQVFLHIQNLSREVTNNPLSVKQDVIASLKLLLE